MAQQVYYIRISGQQVGHRYAWNSACRLMASLIRTMLEEGETAERTTKSIIKRDKWTFESGHFLWTSSQGRTFEATVSLHAG